MVFTSVRARSAIFPIFSVLLATLVAPQSAQAIASFLYYSDIDGVTITGYQGAEMAVRIPATIASKPVVRIANSAFKNESITSVMIPESVKWIEDFAFANCANLESANIPQYVSYMSTSVFYDCRNLWEITVHPLNQYFANIDGVIYWANNVSLFRYPPGKGGESFTVPDGVEHVLAQAFAHCSTLRNISLPAGLKTIQPDAFFGCHELRNIEIPDTVTTISTRAFNSCLNLTNVALPKSLTSVGYYAFSGCRSLSTVSIPDGVTQIEEGAFRHCHNLTEVIMPETLTKIGAGAFNICTNLIMARLPESVSVIGDYAFSKCDSLSTVFIPRSVTNLSASAFRDCGGLEAITVAPENPGYSSYDGLLMDKEQKTLIQFPAARSGSFIIPQSVEKILQMAFVNAGQLTSVLIPNSVTNIEASAFSGCNSLTEVTIPDSVTRLQSYTFARCRNLVQVRMPKSLKEINLQAFASCTNLSSVILPASLSFLSTESFADCFALKSIYFRGPAPFTGTDPFKANTIGTVYYLASQAGWNSQFGGLPTALWTPQLVAHDDFFGTRIGQFGFNAVCPTNEIFVVESSPTLENPVWMPLATNSLDSAVISFSDPDWAHHAKRFYRVRSLDSPNQ